MSHSLSVLASFDVLRVRLMSVVFVYNTHFYGFVADCIKDWNGSQAIYVGGDGECLFSDDIIPQ